MKKLGERGTLTYNSDKKNYRTFLRSNIKQEAVELN